MSDSDKQGSGSFERDAFGVRVRLNMETGALDVSRIDGKPLSACERAGVCSMVALGILGRVSDVAREKGVPIDDNVAHDTVELMRHLYAEAVPGRVQASPAGDAALTAPLDVLTEEAKRKGSRYRGGFSTMLATALAGWTGLLRCYGPEIMGKQAPDGEHAVAHVALTDEGRALSAMLVEVAEHDRSHAHKRAPESNGDDGDGRVPGDEWKDGET